MKKDNNSKVLKIVSASCILIIIAFIKIATFYPNWIEKNYSRRLYPNISWLYRTTFGWMPFSVGDILYAFSGLFLIVLIVKLFKKLINRRFESKNARKNLVKAFFICSSIYIYFNLTWGLNYNRPGIALQLNLDTSSHSTNDLRSLTDTLLKKVNECRTILGPEYNTHRPYHEIFAEAQTAYHQTSAGGLYFLAYNTRSVKRSMYGRLGNYMGFLGYFNPFTGEAQLNLTMPRFLIPFVTCHEIAHQLGYANESEANFVGYLAAKQSSDVLFHYSTYFDLFNYANNELYLTDSVAARNNYKKMNPMVKKDVEELRSYLRARDNFIEPIITAFYDNYLKANQQSEGVKSYNDVTGWLIAYQKKYGNL